MTRGAALAKDMADKIIAPANRIAGFQPRPATSPYGPLSTA
ncbi:hypothetical protein [Streptosporangium lutulentum]|uniref:Uncharacterized protein n=1 Tax=Streptosporangium lutulentum TaxID=1461250 RepID=A0ABT9QUT5_9ACTN|nr:hypothetical protein [Streptosporangium lutulentum]MDP9850161.1 hypothetical protein [Streptosporangium lutulentum]